MGYRHKLLKIGCVLMIGLAFVPARHAAEQVFADVLLPADDDVTNDGVGPSSISIPDSPGANERLAKAQEKEQQRQWKVAAEFYREAVEKYGRRVVPERVDKEADIYRYIGVADAVQRRIARWPQEGLDVYRQVYGQAAAEQLATVAPGDVTGLEKVFESFFITEAGKSAGLRLIDLHLEAGRFATAAAIGRQLLDWHPTIQAQQASVQFSTAWALHLDGKDDQALALQAMLKAHHATDTGNIAGKDVLLADTLDQLLKETPPEPVGLAANADHWPAFNGVDGRGQLSSSTAKPGGSQCTIKLQPPDINQVPLPQRPMFQQADQQDLAAGGVCGIFPACDNGEMFINDGRCLYAVNIDSGQPLPDWAITYPQRNGRYAVPGVFGRARGHQLTSAVTDDRVLAVMGQPDRLVGMMNMAVGETSTRLVCLDRRTGRELWVCQPRNFPDSAGNLRAAELSGCPIIHGDNVIIAANSGRGNQFEECYAVCVNRSTGAFVWSTYLGSALRDFDGKPGWLQSNGAQLAIADGRLFALSNLGTLACLDAADGRTNWLIAYPRDATDFNPQAMFMRQRMAMNGQVSSSRPWSPSPLTVSAGNVFVIPFDARHLLIYDQATGVEQKRIRLSEFDNCDSLLAVRGDWAVVSGRDVCCCLNWRRYKAGSAHDTLIWRTETDNSTATSERDRNTIAGRGFATQDTVFLPTRRQLWQLEFNRSGRLYATYPAGNNTWGSDQSPGNVLLTSRSVIVAGSTQVDVYTDLELLRADYANAIAASPGDPQPRINFASVLFASGHLDDAVARLEEAAKLLAKADGAQAEKIREQLFGMTLGFAEKASRNAAADGKASGDALFERAATYAPGPQQRAAYRLSRARVLHERNELAGEIQLLQEVLSDDAMRASPLSDNTLAGTAAEASQRVAIKMNPQAYEPIEKAAQVALVAARKVSNPAPVLQITLVFPNSRAAAEARAAAAEALESAGRYTEAVEMLRRAYAAADDSAQKDHLQEALALVFLADSRGFGVGAAIDRLTTSIRSADNPKLSRDLPLPGGQSLPAGTPFASAVVQLRAAAAQRTVAGLPDMHLPIPQNPKNPPSLFSDQKPEIADVAALIRVSSTSLPRNDRIVTYSMNKTLDIRPADGTRAVVSNSEFPDAPNTVLWASTAKSNATNSLDLLAWSNARLAMLDDNAKTRWAFSLPGLADLPVADNADAIVEDPSTDAADTGGDGDVQARVMVNGQRVVVGGNQRVVWNRMPQVGVGPGGFPAVGPFAQANIGNNGEQISLARAAGRSIVVATTAGRLIGLDADDGHLLWQKRPVGRQPDRLMVNPHFTVALLRDAVGGQLVVINSATGESIGARRFTSAGQPGELVNAALSEDGTLVWTTNNALFSKDLYERWNIPARHLPAGPDNIAYPGMSREPHLTASMGRIIAAYDGGRFIRVYDRLRGDAPSEPLSTGVGAARNPANVPVQVPPGGSIESSYNISMRLVGSRLFIFGDRRYVQYNLDDASDHNEPQQDFTPMRVRDLLIDLNHAVLVGGAVDAGPAGSALLRLLVYRRTPLSPANPRELGALIYNPQIKEPSGVQSWQAFDGGICYLTGDHKLHLLMGSRK